MKIMKKWSDLTVQEKNDWIRKQYGLDRMNMAPSTIKSNSGEPTNVTSIIPLVRDGRDVEDEYSPIKDKEMEMNLEQTVQDTIEALCEDLVPFTSLDVSNAVKEKGARVRHREVAHLVRQTFATGKLDTHGYLRSMIDVNLENGTTAQAFLYHHSTDDPTSYDDQKRSQTALKPKKDDSDDQKDSSDQDDNDTTTIVASGTPQQLTPTPVPTHAPLAPVMGDTLTRTQKGDGRLEIPGQWMSRLDWEEGTFVSVVSSNVGDGLTLKRNPNSHDHVIQTFTVDRWGRIRLTNGVLNKGGINLGPGGKHTLVLTNEGTIKVS